MKQRKKFPNSIRLTLLLILLFSGYYFFTSDPPTEANAFPKISQPEEQAFKSPPNSKPTTLSPPEEKAFTFPKISKPTWTHKIPRILHQIHKSEEFVLPQDVALRNKCKELMPEWEFEFWSDARIEKFIQEKYAWYYSTWKSYTPFIKRVDTSRYIIMHAIGGVYLDSDVECVKPLDDMITPIEGGAYTGAFPEPMFLMSEPGNKFWLHMLQRINETQNEDTWENTGPVGLHQALVSWAKKHGRGVILDWHKKDWVHTYDPICGNTSFSKSPWYYFERFPNFPPSKQAISADMKIGFICNELLDPAACAASKLASCIDSFCAKKWPHSFTIHHCRSTWRSIISKNPEEATK